MEERWIKDWPDRRILERLTVDDFPALKEFFTQFEVNPKKQGIILDEVVLLCDSESSPHLEIPNGESFGNDNDDGLDGTRTMLGKEEDDLRKHLEHCVAGAPGSRAQIDGILVEIKQRAQTKVTK